MTGPEIRLSARAIARLLGRHEPTDEQVRVIESPLEPALVVAGAGSGKTETMAARVVWLIANKLVHPEQVLGLTFTRKAAGELTQRVQTRLAQLNRALGEESGEALAGLDLDRPTVATYNAYAASLVADHGLRLGVEPSARLLGQAEQWQLASQVVESWDEDLGTDKAVSTVTGAVVALSGALGEHLVDPAEARDRLTEMAEHLESLPLGPRQKKRTKEVEKLIGSVAERARFVDLVVEYRHRKRIAETLDFGDQVAFAAQLAREVPLVGAAERARFEVVLLDEYQDTSYAQVELLTGLFGGGHPVTAVGDPHQSIYGWRGASAGGLARFPDRFRHRDGAPAAVHYLSTSWRNDAAILSAANVVSAPLRSRTGAGGSVEVPPLDLRPGAGDGVVSAHVAATPEEEADAVAEWVAQRWRSGAHPDGRATAAVLCRARAQFPALEVALRRRGLPVEVVGLGGLLSTPEVVDVVALLQAAHDPSRGDSLLRLLTGPRLNLGAADLHALGSWAADLARLDDPRRAAGAARADTPGAGAAPDGTAADPDDGTRVVEGDVTDHRSIVDALDDLPPLGTPARDGRVLSADAHRRLTALARLLRDLRGLTYLSLPELVVQAERALGLDVEAATALALAGAGVGGAVSDRGREHLDAFRDVAASFAQSSDTATLGAFLAWLGVAGERERGLDMPVHEPDPDAVQVITAHAAKGLEWDAVAVAGLADGAFPTWDRGARSGETSSGWLSDLGELPYHLRGDADDLPRFDWEHASDTKDLVALRDEFKLDCGEHRLAEERRLAYVAFTRARSELFLTSSWWGTASRPRDVSPFLAELADAGLVATDLWAPAPEPDAENPRNTEETTALWPTSDPSAEQGPGRGPPPATCCVPRQTAWTKPRSAAWRRSRPRGCPRTPSRRRVAGWRMRPATTWSTWPGCCSPTGTGPPTGRSPSPPMCRRPGWSGWRRTGTRSPSSSAGRCRCSPRCTPGAAPGSTSGWSSSSPRRRCSTSTTCPAPRTTTCPRTPISTSCGTRSWGRSGRPARPWRSRWTSRRRWPVSCSGAGWMPSSGTRPRARTPWSSWTGRPVANRSTRRHVRRARCSSRCTGWRGPGGRVCRWTRSAPRSTTSGRTPRCGRSACSTRPSWRR
nr:ATP-dependent DNA helicase [Promicromonospora thailandica]